MNTSVDDSYRLLAARHIRKQAKRLASQLDGVRQSENIEFIHQARVASRRLRAALRMFRGCFKSKRVARWRKAIRRVTAGLGDARDKDVQIEFLCGVLDRLTEKECYPAVARLMVELEQQREQLQANVIDAVDRLQSSGVLEQMQRVGSKVVAESKAGHVSLQSPVAYLQTEEHILTCLNAMMPYADSLADPEAKEHHHAMRIAAKHLRYTVEISGPVYAGGLDDALAAVKRLQSLLGELHDCDVWLAHLDLYARMQRKRILKHFGHTGPFDRLKAGIKYLKQDRDRQRRQVFEELVAYWRHLEQQGTWDHLVGAIGLPREKEPRTGPPAAPGAAESAALGDVAGGTRR